MDPKRHKPNSESAASRRRDGKQNNSNNLGLADLFGDNRWVRPKDARCTTSGERSDDPDARLRSGPSTSGSGRKPSGFFTLRTEHRTGGPLARHAGEERVLMFRSDRPGAIAKIIFSSSPVVLPREASPEPSPARAASATPRPLENHRIGKSAATIDADERRNPIAADATVHVLFVKDAYRGYDLGGMLFALCTGYLRERYSKTIESDFGTTASSKILSRVRCRLDAEEDIRRHDKLVRFYEHLGCRKRTKAKTTFVNNNDGETYRRIPMAMDLLVPSCSNESRMDRNQTRVAVAYPSFLPVLLVSASGETARVDDRPTDAWLIAECRDGTIELGTTDGMMLRTDGDGRCRLVPTEVPGTSRGADTFRLLWVSDELEEIVCDRGDDNDPSADDMRAQRPPQQPRRASRPPAHRNELWMMRSTSHGTFLGMRPDRGLVLSETASFWRADEGFRLTHTSDSPTRRQHHRRMWRKQCVAYATEMRKCYGSFDLRRTTLEGALTATRHLPANPFSVTAMMGGGESETVAASLPSLRTLLFRTAELARDEGHPDWVQFVALVHGLAAALTCFEATAPESSADASAARTVASRDDRDDEDDFDWTIYVDARVMGCKPFKDSSFAEYRELDPDRGDARCNTTNGYYREHVGLENVLLSWTSSEYMHGMLRHNRVRLPSEAYAILRLFPLVDWHTRGKHTSLSNEEDEVLKPFVADFHELFRRSRDSFRSGGCAGHHEMTDEECRDLWTNHYSLIAKKYGAGDALNW